MNPLKFKAYCADRNEWVNIIDLGMFSTGEVKEVAYTYDSEPYERHSSYLDKRPSNWRKGNNIILVQYTGLKDRSNVEIYEKDILRWNVFDGLAYFGGTNVVYFQDGAFRLNKHHSVIDYINNGDVEVVGNIHEHPELLEAAQ